MDVYVDKESAAQLSSEGSKAVVSTSYIYNILNKPTGIKRHTQQAKFAFLRLFLLLRY
jgi:hypothetical protein